jgi:hypothetical protein
MQQKNKINQALYAHMNNKRKMKKKKKKQAKREKWEKNSNHMELDTICVHWTEKGFKLMCFQVTLIA